MSSVLIIAGNPAIDDAFIATLSERGYDINVVNTAGEGLTMHRERGADLVLVSLPLPDSQGPALLARLRAQDPRVVVVVSGEDAFIHGAPEAFDFGASDYVVDPMRDTRSLLYVLGVNLGVRRSDAQLRYLRRKDAAGADWSGIIGRCAAMREVFGTVRQICHRTSTGGKPTILISGETGTGKGLIAKAIHYNSVRRSRAFVDVNCAAIPASMTEAELFGHVRGAFTDARTSRPGLFEVADGGSLFLDEIGALNLELQGKLLTAIEEQSIRRIGATEKVHIDVQVITATHRDVHAMVKLGEFREDLYHRLNVISLELPPLRERGEDRLLLAETFIEDMCRQYGLPPKRLDESARTAIDRYDWPGNVRELRNRIERIVLLHEGDVIRAEDFQLDAAQGKPPRSLVADVSEDSIKVNLPEGGCSLEILTANLEREVIYQALLIHSGNVTQTARYLEITRQALIYRMRKHGLRSEAG